VRKLRSGEHKQRGTGSSIFIAFISATNLISILYSNGELRFDSLPISSATLAGLALANLTIATEIQAAALPHALAGRDILGAAKTGSGKTLSFVIPLVEKLYMERWAPGDGLAAVIITPTRELALQIFEVLRIVGKKHCFSAGLITGGRKDFEGEQERIAGMNILVATPGRFLQHLEQTVGFDASQVMVLVLDEADRILDMGFKAQLDSIIQYLPANRQTMLFSATQTKSVKDLARLSLNQPEYLAVHAEDDEVTPKQLVQNYIICKLPEKLDVLFSFLKTHLKSKMIVFLSTCSQVRFVYECFRAMQPGTPLSCLHGKIKQDKRTSIYVDFSRKKAACLLCTDIAARGLDFPNVDWVVQLDAPEDAAMYIHRVGRTARYNSNGRALLMLMPTEEKQVVDALNEAHVPIKKLTVNPNKRFTVAVKAAALLAAQPELKTLAKKAFVGYLRSLQLLPGGRSVLDPSSTLPVAEYATALGLAFAPPVVAIPANKLSNPEAAREENREQKNVNRYVSFAFVNIRAVLIS
jgi:ATP-dependent RNA helicase DDX10/DBP4